MGDSHCIQFQVEAVIDNISITAATLYLAILLQSSCVRGRREGS